MSTARLLLSACLAIVLAACQGERSPAPVTASSSAQPQSAEAESTIDGATLHVTALQASRLAGSVARDYGIARSPRTILLLVNLRDAGDPPPAIAATVTDLQQHTTPVALRALHVAQAGPGTRDYVGTVEATLPDTLRFTVTAERGGARASVQISRDFYPE